MGYYDFPHTRNYDSDLGELIRLYKELISTERDYATVEYVDAHIQSITDLTLKLLAEAEKRITVAYTSADESSALVINTRISNEVSTLNDKIIRGDQELKRYIDSQIIDVKVLNPVTGKVDTIQGALNSLAGLHKTGTITAAEYDEKKLTATAYDEKLITAFNYDFDAKNYL